MKKIIHLQIPMDDNGEFKLDYNTAEKFYRNVKEIVNDEYYVIVTPMEPTITEYIKNINMEELYDIPYDEWYDYIKSKMEEHINET